MSRPVKIAILFLVTLIYACASWMIFDLQVSIASTGFWLWITSLFLLIGAGFRVITNKFFGSFFVSYLMFGIAGLILLLLIGMKIASLPVFNKDSYTALANISVSELSNYSMTEQDFSILPKQVAAGKAAEDLSSQMPSDSGFLLMGGDLQYVNGTLYYVFSLDNKDKTTASPGFVYVDAKTGTSTYKKTDVQMVYSPYQSGDHDVLRCVALAGGKKKAIVETHLEVDENLAPWWISYEYGPVSIMGGRKLSAVYLTNPFTGGSTKYNIEAIPSWVDYKISLELSTDIFDTAAKLNKLDVSIDDSAVMIMPRGNELYAYYNLTKGKDQNGGVAFLNLKTGAAAVYLQDTVNSERIMKCLEAWAISTSQKTLDIPVLTKVNDEPCFVSPTYDENGAVSSYLFISAQDGSSYSSGKTWSESAENFSAKEAGETSDTDKTETPPTEQPSESPEEGGEGVTYNLIAGYVDTITTDGNQYVITLVAMKPKYYIDSTLITQEELEAAKTNGLALQYPIEYDGKLEVHNCVPVEMSVMG